MCFIMGKDPLTTECNFTDELLVFRCSDNDVIAKVFYL